MFSLEESVESETGGDGSSYLRQLGEEVGGEAESQAGGEGAEIDCQGWKEL